METFTIDHLASELNKIRADLKLFVDRKRNYKSLKSAFKKKIGYELNLDNPKSYNEKIIWKKLNDRNPLLTLTADKYAVRDYIKDAVGEDTATSILIPLYYVTKNPGDIPFEDLPDKFVIKPNHGSQMHLIVKNKKNIPSNQMVNECKKWLKTHHGLYNYEWAYRNIKRKIIVEKLLETNNGSLPLDYKLFCFHGECKYIRAQFNRFDKEVLTGYFNLDWELLPVYRPGYNPINVILDKPQNLDKMITIAEKISRQFDAVRVDLYNCDGKIYFGELTHYDFCGLARFEPESFDFTLGKHWVLEPDYWLNPQREAYPEGIEKEVAAQLKWLNMLRNKRSSRRYSEPSDHIT